MRLRYSSPLLLAMGLYTHAQTPTHQAVVHNLAGTTSSVVNGVAVDGDGNMIITGWRTDTLNFGGTIHPQDGGAIFLAKIDPQGNEIWSKVSTSADQNGYNKGVSVAVDGTGNIYNAGWVFAVQEATFDGITLPLGSAGYVAKYTSSGTLLWVKDFAGGVNAIAVDGNGNPFINLGDASIEKLDPSNGNTVASGTGGGDLQNVGNHNIVVDGNNHVIAQWGNKITKYDNGLVEQWNTPLVKPFGSAESHRITVDGSGNVWATFYAIFGTVTLGGTDYTNFPAGYIYSLSGADGAVLSATSMGAFKMKKVYHTVADELLLIGDGAFNTPYLVKYDPNLTALWSVATFGVVDMEMIANDCVVLCGAHDETITLDGITYERPNNSAQINAMAGYLCAGAVGVREYGDASGALSLSPNPASDRIVVTTHSDVRSVRIADMRGGQVFQAPVRGGRLELDLTGLANGVYLVRDDLGRGQRLVIAH